MANVLIGGLTATTSAGGSDLMELETSGGLGRKITVSNLLASLVTLGAATKTGAETLTNKTLTSPTVNGGALNLGAGTLVLPAAASPAQTAEGSAVWDSDDDVLTVGTGSGGRVTLVDLAKAQTLTSKTLSGPTITATTAFRAADGSASVPSVSFVNDTNTGLFSAGADLLALALGGTERARWSAYAQAIGAAPGAWNTTFGALQAGLAGAFVGARTGAAGGLFIFNNAVYDATAAKYVQDGYAAMQKWDTGKLEWYVAPSGTAAGTITWQLVLSVLRSGALQFLNLTGHPATPTGGAILYSISGELWGKDTAGNQTQQTPHADEIEAAGAGIAVAEDDPHPHIGKEMNSFLGLVTYTYQSPGSGVLHRVSETYDEHNARLGLTGEDALVQEDWTRAQALHACEAAGRGEAFEPSEPPAWLQARGIAFDAEAFALLTADL